MVGDMENDVTVTLKRGPVFGIQVGRARGLSVSEYADLNTKAIRALRAATRWHRDAALLAFTLLAAIVTPPLVRDANWLTLVGILGPWCIVLLPPGRSELAEFARDALAVAALLLLPIWMAVMSWHLGPLGMSGLVVTFLISFHSHHKLDEYQRWYIRVTVDQFICMYAEPAIPMAPTAIAAAALEDDAANAGVLDEAWVERFSEVLTASCARLASAGVLGVIGGPSNPRYWIRSDRGAAFTPPWAESVLPLL